MAHKIDKELEEFRGLMQVPSTFQEGFNWTSLLGAVFIALLMVPGSIYMGLLAGTGIGPAAQWVTVILFIEVAKRAQRHLNRSEIFVLFFMAGAAMGMPFHGLIWNQFFVRSDSAMAYGVAEYLPHWFAPAADSASYELRTFFHRDWIPAIALIIFGTFFGQLASMILGYGLFRMASDFEKLPFPMAPIGAQGIIALAEDVDAPGSEHSWRWRAFSIGGALGLAFGAIYLGLPTLSGALTGQPIQIFPIPFSDFTQKTQSYLPAVATGIAWDLGNLLMGMVMPFFAMVGSLIGLITTFVLNPVLYHYEILSSWTSGDDTISTLFKNNIDFYFSFQIGIAIAIAVAGFWQVFKSVQSNRRERSQTGVKGPSLAQRWRSEVPKGRGDIPLSWVILCYFVVTMAYILVSGYLIHWHKGVMIILFGLGFLYTPFISYVTARLEGIAGQVVEIPYIREASLILSGYRGVACWFLPIPVVNYGGMTVFYRQCELTGTRFTGIWKTQIVLYPIILISSILFMNFIWSLAEIPSAVYPFAQRMWELQSANACIMYSSTLGEYSIFEDAFNATYIACGAGFGVLLFAGLTSLGAPIFLVYGVVRGLGQNIPHSIIPQFIGALIGRYYFQKRLKLMWRQYIPVVAAGFFCGQGLVTTVCVGITFLSKAAIQMPF